MKNLSFNRRDFYRALFLFGLVNCVIFYLNAWSYLPSTPSTLLESVYLYAAFVSLFLLMALLLTGIFCLVYMALRVRLPAAAGAVSLFTLAQAYIFVDVRIFAHFRFHINGLVLQSMLTPGYWDSMHFSALDKIFTASAALALLATEAGLLFLLHRQVEKGKFPAVLGRRPVVLSLLGALILLSLGEKLIYGVSDLYGLGTVAPYSRIFPFYRPITFRRWYQKRFGLPEEAKKGFQRLRESEHLNYPRPGFQNQPLSRPYNVVVLLMEGTRADMFSPEIMPNLTRFGEEAIVGLNHYSAGDTTRFGVFGLFYGLPGTYWSYFLNARRMPVLFNRLLGNNYEFKVMSSTSLKYPEFDRTLFAELPVEIEDRFPGADSAERDTKQVQEFLEWLPARSSDRPFFTFMFFDSPHAIYFFPEEFAKFKPYVESFSFVRTDLHRQRDEIFNRYRNSVHWLDHLLGRVLNALEESGKLEETIVVVTGDHGEEFWEKGYYGHNSAYTRYQVNVPLVLRIPGEEPRKIAEMTSHLDLAPTILRILGDENPIDLYSVGHDLLGEERAESIILSGWSDCCLVTPRLKMRFSTDNYRLFGSEITDLEDRPVEDRELIKEEKFRYLLPALEQMGLFLK